MDERPSLAEALAAAIAGLAFAGSAVFLRGATLVPAPVFDGLALAILAFGLAPSAGRWLAPPVGTLLRGLGLVGGAILASAALVPPFDRAALPVALWLGGGALLQTEARLAARNPWLYAAGGLVAAAGTAVAVAFADGFPTPDRLRMVVVGATLAAGVGLVLREAALRRRSWKELAPRPTGILFVCALGAAYLGYRASVATKVANLPLYEWTLGVGVATLVLARLRRSARETATPEAWASEARRHAQDVSPVYDARMAPMAAIVQRYLDSGDGFEGYRDVMRRAYGAEVPLATPGRGGREARYQKHAELTKELTHGRPPPRLRSHP